MTVGTLVKITNNRKLMIKIDDATHQFLTSKCIRLLKLKDLPTDRLPTFTLTKSSDSLDSDKSPKLGDSEGNVNFFVMLSLDKYDKPNCSKFESLVKKQVSFNGIVSTYDFIPDGDTKQVIGCNYTLTGSIHATKLQPTAFDKYIDKRVDNILNPPPMTEFEQQLSDELDQELLNRLPKSKPQLIRQ
jgi:hypothetical protein